MCEMKVPSLQSRTTMEDNSSSLASSQNHNGQLSASSGVTLNNKHTTSGQNGRGNANQDMEAAEKEQQARFAAYSMPGILHFIQHEWARFELERSQWELDRAEFQVIRIVLMVIFQLLIAVLDNFSITIVHIIFNAPRPNFGFWSWRFYILPSRENTTTRVSLLLVCVCVV